MFHWDTQIPRRELKNMTRGGVFFEEIPGVWIANETFSRVFDILSQWNQKLRVGVNGEVKSSKSMLTKTGYPNFLHGCNFLCFNLMNC